MSLCDWDPGIDEVITVDYQQSDEGEEARKERAYYNRFCLGSFEFICSIGFGSRIGDDLDGGANRQRVNGATMADLNRIEGIRREAIIKYFDLIDLGSYWLVILNAIWQIQLGSQGINTEIVYFRKTQRMLIYFGKLVIRRIRGKYFGDEMRFSKIICHRDDIEWESVGSNGMEIWVYYKISTAMEMFFSRLNIFSHSMFSYSKGLIVNWFLMAQGKLTGAMGDSRNGEGTRKRLKITVAHFDNSDLIRSCSRILVGRCMNPPAQEMPALLSNLPKIWKLEDRVIGKDLGLGKFQFEFEREEDMEGVLRHQPYHFDYWMIAVAKWQPKRVVDVDVDLMPVLVVVDAFKELCFETSVDFTEGEFYDGEEVQILLRYEKLFGYCDTCGSLCHLEAKCPLLKDFKQHPEKKIEAREGSGGWNEGNKYDDRARSYKGVAIHGNEEQQHRERNTREYHGKGKGKMYDDADAKWVRVADRSNMKQSGNNGYNRGNGEGSRHKSSRMEDEQLAKTQADGAEVVSDPTDAVKGLKQLQGMVEGQLKIGEDDEVMDWADLEAAEDLPELTEEEFTALNAELEDQAGLEDIEEPLVNGENKEQLPEGENTKQVTKKRIFKSTQSTAASTKMRSAKALASPRKKVPARAGPRLGDNRHQQESKVASNLMAVHQKP
ncbi:hypothetical protein Rs2_30240 [Raphanus sativus]|nr:hypothetical protein Rs2_30240 [Raphanus sativus]